MQELREDQDSLVQQIADSFLAYRALMVGYSGYASNGVMNARALQYNYK